MNPQAQTVSVDHLMAYVDGRLTADERVRVEAYLAEHPEAREQANAYRNQNVALHAAFDGVLAEPLPERFRTPPRPRPAYGWMAAVAASMVAGVALGWFAHRTTTVPRPVNAFVHQAAVAHIVYSPEVRHPVEVAANEEAHLVAWLSKRLGRNVKAPNLADRGFRLVGGRLLPGEDGRAAAQFMYEDERGQRLTLYIRAITGRDRDTAFRYTKEAGVDTFYWVDANWGYALSGSIGREAMLDIADVVYKQISPT